MTDTTLTDRILAQLDQVILGKQAQLRLALACLLARGHLLIEDLPGMGKTTLAHSLAQTLGLQFQRIQFTSDLLPADVLGVSVYDQEAHRFNFHPGPVFSQVVLADEINRATPKAQSALLEAMEEQQVTVEGETRRLPEPFFVIATQNPTQQIGTFPLPESQLDRFLMRLELGYPDAAAERELLRGRDRRDLLADLQPVTGSRQLMALQQAVGTIKVTDPLIDYIQALLQYTREPARYHMPLSPRGGLALLRAAQAWALLAGRDYVLPEDVQAVLPSVAGHRLHPVEDEGLRPAEVVAQLIAQVAIP
ncbi:MAG: MoxR family ATPase [Gammaproteobacteria bacterium]|nr:MoxR family ATPase [Gammaproteobacteria bacterium]